MKRQLRTVYRPETFFVITPDYQSQIPATKSGRRPGFFLIRAALATMGSGFKWGNGIPASEDCRGRAHSETRKSNRIRQSNQIRPRDYKGRREIFVAEINTGVIWIRRETLPLQNPFWGSRPTRPGNDNIPVLWQAYPKI